MKRYRVTAEMTISVSTVVKAKSKKAAMDLDGEPKNLSAEEEDA